MSKQDAEISEWLTSMGVAQHFNAPDIESGKTVASILFAVDRQCKIQLQEGNSAIVRVSNWNAIVQYLKKIDIKMSQQQKSKIINGNHDLVFKIISKLREVYQRSAKQTEINLKTIDSKRQIKDSESLLQLFLLAIIKHFSLSPKESLSLLSNQAKYLAHLLAKGLKGDFRPIDNLVAQLSKNMSKIVSFCKNKQNEMFFLKAIKPALISKSESVTENTINLVHSFLMNYNVNDRFYLMKEYLVPTFMLAIRRHSQLTDQVVRTSLELVDFNENIITNLYENTSKNDFFILFISLWKIFEQQQKTTTFTNSTVFKKLIDHITDGFKDPDLAVTGISCCLQMAHSDFAVFQKCCGDKLVDSIKEIIFSKECQNVEYLHLLFVLLSITGANKHQLAPLIYKIIAARLSNAGEIQYEILINGLYQIYNDLPSIPVTPILDAITQRAELRVGQLQILIFSKILAIGTEARVAVNIYNIVSRSFIQDVGFGKELANLMIDMLSTYKQEQILLDMTAKLTKVSLALYFANVKKLAQKRKPLSHKNKLDPDEAYSKLKMFEIEYFLRRAIQFGDKDLIENIQPLICFSYLQIVPLSKQQAKGLEPVIALMGDINKLIAKYNKELEADVPQNKSKSKHIEASSPDQQRNTTQEASNLARSVEKQRKERILSSHPLHPMSLSMMGVKPDAFMGLEKYAKRHQIKALAQQSKRYQAIQAQEDKNKLKKLYQKKMVLQKALKFKGVNEAQINYLFQFDSKQVYAETNHLYLNYYSPEAEEDRDAQGVQQYMRRYQKTLRVYYNIYSGKKAGFHAKNFDEILQKNNLMHTSNIAKLLKDHGLQGLITANQLRAIARRVNYRFNNIKDDPQTLDFEGFKQFVLQMAFTMYTRPPKDLRGRPVPQMLDQLFSTLKLYASQNRVNNQLFQEPQACFVGQQEAVKLLNQRLQQNPDYILPQGYKKITETRINLDHKIYLQAMSPTYKEVYQVIDEILFSKFKFHVIEPFTTQKKVCWARPNVYTLQKNKLGEVQTKHLPVHFKKEVSKFPIMERAIAKEAAHVLADIVRAVELNHDEIGLKHENPLIKSKKEKQEELKRQKQAAQQKRKYIDRQLKTSMDAYKTTKQAKQQKLQQQKRHLEEKKKQEKEKNQKRTKQLKQKLQQFNEKKKQQQQAKKASQQSRIEKQKAEAERKKRQLQQTKRKIEELKKQKEAQEKQKKQREQEEQKRRKQQQKRKLQKAQKQKKQKIEEYKQRKKKGQTSKVMDAPVDQQLQNEQNP